MATKSTVVRMKRVEKTVKKYAELRRKLKEAKDYAGLQKLPRDASPTRVRSLCALTGRSRAVYRKFAHEAAGAGLGGQDPRDEEVVLVSVRVFEVNDRSSYERREARNQRKPQTADGGREPGDATGCL